MARKTLYIPVETVARELDAKLLLAIFAANQGMRVVLGNRQFLDMNIHRFSPGIYLSHNITKNRRRILSILKDLGFSIATWDEEGLVWLSPDIYLRRRIDEENARLIERFYAWGGLHASVLRKVLPHDKVLESGNPRMDFLTEPLVHLYSSRKQQLIDEFGPYVLINSNFGWLNYELSKGKAKDRDRYIKEISRKSGHPASYIEYREKVFRSMFTLADVLARSVHDRTIIIRPHPSESKEHWLPLSRKHDNIKVVYDSELIPWLMGAEAVIHNGCTTAIEAAVLGKLTISYENVRNEFDYWNIPSMVSLRATAPDEVLDILNNTDDALRNRRQERTRNALKDIISGISEKTISAEVICEDLASLDISLPRKRHTLKTLLAGLKSRIRKVEKKLHGIHYYSTSHSRYIDKKFPPMQVMAVQEKVNAICRIIQQHREENIVCPRVTEIQDRLYELEI